jgi:hypothetical protein
VVERHGVDRRRRVGPVAREAPVGKVADGVGRAIPGGVERLGKRQLHLRHRRDEALPRTHRAAADRNARRLRG